MPFDRLIGWVDDWAETNHRDDVVAQIGPSELVPRHLKVAPFMTPPEFRSCLAEADIVIAHAGMGSIIDALQLSKPIVVVPRLGALDETRNDHQVATARRLTEMGLVLSAGSPEELATQLGNVLCGGRSASIGDRAEASLLERLRDFAQS